MGRKNLAEIRSEAILTAFERCVVMYGIDVSMEQIADEAKVRRSIIRHYIGNRETLVNSLIERITQAYPAQIEAALSHSGGADEIHSILHYLFRSEGEYTGWDKIIVDVLMTAKERYPQAKRSLMQMFAALIDHLTQALVRAYPAAPPERCWQIAYALFCLAQTNESLVWLGVDQRHNSAARESAEILLRSLESTEHKSTEKQ